MSVWVDRPRRRPLLVFSGRSNSSAGETGDFLSSGKAGSLISGGGVKGPGIAGLGARVGDVCCDANDWKRSGCVVHVLSCAAASIESMSE